MSKIKFRLALILIISLFCSSAIAAKLSKKQLHAAHKHFMKHIHFVNNRPLYRTDKIIVKFKSGVTSVRMNSTVTQLADKSRSISRKRKIRAVILRSDQTVTDAMQTFKNDPTVQYVQPAYVYRKFAIPNDVEYSKLWGLKNDGSSGGVQGADIKAEEAWNHLTDCSAAIVAVIDTGLNYRHSDISANLWVNPGEIANDGIDNDGNNIIDDVHGADFVVQRNGPVILKPVDGDPILDFPTESHGTHVAGIIGASGNNNIGITGVCWKAKIMALKVFLGEYTDTEFLVNAIDYAVANGAKVINMSLGVIGFDQSLYDSMEAARDSGTGVVFAIAAGNDSFNVDTGGIPIYPCAFDLANIICVASITKNDQRANSSNFGVTSVDIAAPGDLVLSTIAGSIITVDTTTGWNLAGDWGFDRNCFSAGISAIGLVNPQIRNRWCVGTGTGTYASNISDVAYKTFDIAAMSPNARDVNLTARLIYDTESGQDFVEVRHDITAGNPFLTTTQFDFIGSGFHDLLAEFNAGYSRYLMDSCLGTSTCSIGIRLQSNATVNLGGVMIADMKLVFLEDNADLKAYQLYSGTSMAAPHVAGVLAMVRSLNPDYTYSDAVSAVLNGGRALSNISSDVKTGSVVSAIGAISQILVPSGFDVTYP